MLSPTSAVKKSPCSIPKTLIKAKKEAAIQASDEEMPRDKAWDKGPWDKGHWANRK